MFDLMVICPKMTWYLLKGGHCSVDDKSRLILGELGKMPRYDPFPLSMSLEINTWEAMLWRWQGFLMAFLTFLGQNRPAGPLKQLWSSWRLGCPYQPSESPQVSKLLSTRGERNFYFSHLGEAGEWCLETTLFSLFWPSCAEHNRA